MKTWKTALLITAMTVGICFYVFQQRPSGWTLHQQAGLAIIIPALFLWALARFQLGESFSIRAQAKQLVTHGLYSKIRNPIYVFGAIFIAGLFTFIGNPYLFLIFAVLIPAQIVRARREERVLEEAFGQQYRDYKRRTWC